MFPTQAEDAESLLRRADVAMYVGEGEPAAATRCTRPRWTSTTRSRLTLSSQVRPAIERGEFVMFYQPKVRLADGRVAGAEALDPLEAPERGLVPPDEFIPLVEKTVLLASARPTT